MILIIFTSCQTPRRRGSSSGWSRLTMMKCLSSGSPGSVWQVVHQWDRDVNYFNIFYIAGISLLGFIGNILSAVILSRWASGSLSRRHIKEGANQTLPNHTEIYFIFENTLKSADVVAVIFVQWDARLAVSWTNQKTGVFPYLNKIVCWLTLLSPL